MFLIFTGTFLSQVLCLYHARALDNNQIILGDSRQDIVMVKTKLKSSMMTMKVIIDSYMKIKRL